ncbi:hypothetical protein R0131_09515 [Clostridium sp. AL.422]|uniref:hypothetical protein n=1 Tax=Clostridium TaxID=1485 RepID=UPI00293DFAF5|nr:MULTISPECIES: hypothetical protein [unclassified Clostridium]MDV4151075.1 hypothetical protein [Clostridium sp. AL.422]
MKNRIVGILIKSIIWGLIWLGLAAIVGFIITKILPDKSFENILFIEGLVLVFGGIFASISGDPMGLSMQGLGQNNAQYITNANLEIAKMQKEKSGVKIDIGFSLSTFALLIGGILSVIVTFIM